MKRKLSKVLLLCLVLALITAAALTITACNKKEDAPGAGAEKRFTLEVTFMDGTEKSEKYSTDKEILGDFLQDEGVIAGDDSEFGLFVKTVMGQTVDYDTDGKYWAFYVNGEMAMAGVDSTEIEDGAVYAFKAES